MHGNAARFRADEYLDAAVFYEPRSFSREDFFAAMCAQSVELPDGALGILKELAASDKCRVGSLNNEARETNEYRIETFRSSAISGVYVHVRATWGSASLTQRFIAGLLSILGQPAGAYACLLMIARRMPRRQRRRE